MRRKKAAEEPASPEPAPQPSGLEQVRALSHPLRLRLLELFAARARTAKQAAEELGEPPTRLYHHVAALEKAGLIRLCETKRKRGTTEKYFEVVQRRVVADELPRGAEAQRDLAAMGFVVFDQARNELARALAAANDQEQARLFAIRGVFRFSPAAAKRLQKELSDLLGRLRTDESRQRGPRAKLRRYSLTIAFLPAEGEAE
jgi:DNA-binding transcriptional ArsR family regulator